MTSPRDPSNPLGMRQFEEEGPWVLPDTPCSIRRVEFLRRSNSFLGFYHVITATAHQGFELAKAAEADGKINDSTPIRVALGGTESRMIFGRFKRVWASAGRHLTNQVFLMIYGNFEAYLADLLMDGLNELEPSNNPYEVAKTLLVGRKWEGKIAAIDFRLSLGLRGRLVNVWFKDLEMVFLGSKCSQPLDFLEKVSDLRDRLVHYGSRVDAGLMSEYPGAGFKLGDEIGFPFDAPVELHFFLAHLSDLIDEAFCVKFGWDRPKVSPEKLL